MDIGTSIFLIILFSYLLIGAVLGIVAMLIGFIKELRHEDVEMNHWNYAFGILLTAPILNIVVVIWYLSDPNRPKWLASIDDLKRWS